MIRINGKLVSARAISAVDRITDEMSTRPVQQFDPDATVATLCTRCGINGIAAGSAFNKHRPPACTRCRGILVPRKKRL